MTGCLSVYWIHGRPAKGAEEDEARALAAAQSVLDAAGVDPAAAEAEFVRQLEEFEEESPMKGLARTWIEARQAADIALTDGWHDPAGASCGISVA